MLAHMVYAREDEQYHALAQMFAAFFVLSQISPSALSLKHLLNQRMQGGPPDLGLRVCNSNVSRNSC